MTDALPIALVAGVLAAAGIGALYMAFEPTAPRLARPGFVDESSHGLLLAGVLVGFVVLAVTRWPVAAAAAGVFVGSWRWLFASTDNANDRATIEAIAQWLEDLRDVVRRSSVALENAVELVAEDASGVLADPMHRFLLRRRQGRPLPEALAELADDIGHRTADAAVAAIVLVVGGGAGGGRVFDTLDELSMAARDEMRARDEIDRTRRVFQRAMRRLVILTVLFVSGLAIFAGDLLAPYRAVPGQIWLLVPCGLWATCLVMLRRLTRYDLGTRYRLRLPSDARPPCEPHHDRADLRRLVSDHRVAHMASDPPRTTHAARRTSASCAHRAIVIEPTDGSNTNRPIPVVGATRWLVSNGGFGWCRQRMCEVERAGAVLTDRFEGWAA